MKSNRTHARIAAAALGLLAAACLWTPAAGAEMRSTKLDDRLCETTGGGRFVDIPGFPGERIDRRLLRDIRWMRRNFEIFVTDGYSTAPYHSRNGEHPIGLALDIVPAAGGSWNQIARLAEKAEPRQDQPRPPWRWVGWNGDAGHGRGDHLHLSYMHSPTPPRDPARTVYTRRCPDGTNMLKSAGTGALKLGGLIDRVAPAVPEAG